MTPRPETLKAGDPLAFALNRMMVGGYRHIPIEEDGKLAGIVSVRHVLKYLTSRFPDAIPESVTA
jgi:CBS domain-containing protein